MAKGERNYGVDIARISAILFVLILHNLNFGKLLFNSQITGMKWGAVWSLEVLTAIAVNVFAIITGYLLTGRSYRGSRILDVIFQALFWSWVTLVFIFMFIPFSRHAFFAFAFPISRYWYVNAYVGMMLLVPFIDKGVNSLNKQQFLAIIVVLSAICTTIGFFGHFFLERGYSAYWLILMYLVGAYIRRFPPKIIKSTVGWFCAYLSTSMLSILAVFIAKKIGMSTYAFIDYDSPLIFMASIFFFLFCINLRIQRNWIKRMLIFLSPAAFGAYIINASIITSGMLANIQKLSFLSPVMLTLAVIFIAIFMFVVSACLDHFRMWIFKKAKVNELSKASELIVKRVLYGVADKI